MATRSKTAVFVRVREARIAAFGSSNPSKLLGKNDDKKYNLLENGEGYDVQLPDAEPWIKESEDVKKKMTKIKQMMSDLRVAQQKALRSIVGGDDDEQTVEILTAAISGLFGEVQRSIKRINDSPSEGGKNSTHAAFRLNCVRQMATEVSELSRAFRKGQAEYMGRIRIAEEHNMGLSGTLDGPSASQKQNPFHDDDDMSGIVRINDDDLNNDSAFSPFRDTGFTDSQVMASETADAIIRERDQQIRQIQKSVEELAVLMKDLLTLVIDQGTILDRIDYNVEMVKTHVEEGLVQLNKASKSQASARYKLCIILLIFLIVLLASVIFFRKFLGGHKSSDDE